MQLGIVENTIPNSTVRFGTPAPTENYCDSDVTIQNEGANIFQLASFPFEDLPSGGASCRSSPSEMVVLRIEMRNYEPRNDSGEYTLYYLPEDGGQEKLIRKVVTGDFPEESWWTWWTSWDFVTFGRFGWEINAPGYYAIEAVYPQGTVRWVFLVQGEALVPDLAPPQLSLPPPPREEVAFPPEEAPPVSQPPAAAPKCPRGQQYTAESWLGIFAVCDDGYRKIEGSNDCECQYDSAGNLVKPGASACADNDWSCQLGKIGKYIIPGIIVLFVLSVIRSLRK